MTGDDDVDVRLFIDVESTSGVPFPRKNFAADCSLESTFKDLGRGDSCFSFAYTNPCCLPCVEV